MADVEEFNFKFFVKEVEYGRDIRKGEYSSAIGIKLLDFPTVFISSETTNDFSNEQSTKGAKGKSCRFLMTRGNLINLLQTSPHSIQVCLVGSSHDQSRGHALASGVLNDNTAWCDKLSSVIMQQTSSLPVEVLNKSYLIYLVGADTNKLGHVILKLNILVSTNNSLEIDTSTGQCWNSIREQSKDHNLWTPPPLFFTAHSISGHSSPTAISSDHELEYSTIQTHTSHWDPLVHNNINSWPLYGFQQLNVTSHSNKCQDIRCDQEAGKADVFSMESVDCKEKELCFPVLSALCNEVKLLEKYIVKRQSTEMVDKGTQTEVLEETSNQASNKGVCEKISSKTKTNSSISKSKVMTIQTDMTKSNKKKMPPSSVSSRQKGNMFGVKISAKIESNNVKQQEQLLPQPYSSHVTPSRSSVHSSSPSQSNVHSPSPSQSNVHSPSPSQSNVHSPSPSQSNVHSPSPSQSNVHSPSPSQSNVHSPSPSQSNVHSLSPSQSNVHSPSPSQSNVHSPSPSQSPIQSQSCFLSIPSKHKVSPSRSGTSTPVLLAAKKPYHHLLPYQSFGGSHESLEGTKSFLHPKLLDQKVYLASSLQSIPGGQQINSALPEHQLNKTKHSKLDKDQHSDSSSVVSEDVTNEEGTTYSEDFESDTDD